MNLWEEPIPNETPAEREQALRQTLEEIWIQGKDYSRSSMPWRMSFKAQKILKQMYGDNKYDRIS